MRATGELRKKARAEEFRRTLAQASPSRWHTNYPLKILKPLGLRKGDRFLDVGSGPGLHVAGAWMKGAHATGVDFSLGNVVLGRKLATEVAGRPRRERRKFLSDLFFAGKVMLKLEDIFARTRPSSVSRMGFIPATGARLPIKSGSMDKILSLDTLHWIHSSKGRESMLKEILRVAKPGGRIMITSDPYLYGRNKAITAQEHILEVARKEGIELGVVRGKAPPTFVVLKKGEPPRGLAIRRIIGLARGSYKR